jgi:hypothetical protein
MPLLSGFMYPLDFHWPPTPDKRVEAVYYAKLRIAIVSAVAKIATIFKRGRGSEYERCLGTSRIERYLGMKDTEHRPSL